MNGAVERIAVEFAAVIANQVVEVKGKLIDRRERGGKVTETITAPRDFTVYFDRHGEIKFGHTWVPDRGQGDTYLRPEIIPEAVKEAANREYEKENPR
jgi:hypothetical protein